MVGMKERPSKSRFIRTPDQIRAQVALLRASPDPEVQNLAPLGEAFARAIERRALLESGLFDNAFFKGRAPWDVNKPT